MDKFVSLETYKINEAAGGAGYWLSQKDANKLVASITSFINSQVEQLKADMLSGKFTPTKRGTFDRLKNWWYNAIMGYENKKNPYYKSNILGKLGRVSEMTLRDYKFLLSEAKKFQTITANKTNLDKVLDNWSFEFKKELENRVREFLSNAYVEKQPSASTKPPKPEKKNTIVNPVVSEPVEVAPAEKPIVELPKKDSKDDDEEQQLEIEKNPDYIELKNIIQAIITKEEDQFMDNPDKKILEDEESFYFDSFLISKIDYFSKNPDKIQTVTNMLKNYLNDKNMNNFERLKNNLDKLITENKEKLKSLSEIKINKTGKLDFQDTTLYERTIECLDKMRSSRF